MAVPPETTNIPDYKNIKVVKVGKLHNRFGLQDTFTAQVGNQEYLRAYYGISAEKILPKVMQVVEKSL